MTLQRKVKVRFMGTEETKEVSSEEAVKIIDDIYRDDMGGFVVNAKTLEIITQLVPDVEEIVVIQQVLGGG
jgi:hypothetical protein